MLGRLTRTYRSRSAISQEELAERTGLSSRAIRAIETGRSAKPRPATVRLLADALGLSDQEREEYFTCALGRAAVCTAPPERTAPEPTAPEPTAPEPTVPEPTAPVPDVRAAAHVPRGLPLAVPVFAGRGRDLATLTALLDDGRPGAVVISGTAGVGKSTLAVHWAHQIADRFPDGQLFVNLGGFGPAQARVGPGDAIRVFLQALEVPARRIPADLDGQVALYRSVLAGRRVLVVVDNAHNADQVRPLIPGTADCLVLVTSRRQLTSLVTVEGAAGVCLDLLTHDEARTLMTGRLGARRVTAEPVAVDALIDCCVRLPLALSVVAARAALRPQFPLADIVDQLGDPGERLDQLSGGDAVSDVRTVFFWSYRQLGAAARLFRLLGLHPGPDIGGPAAAGLVGAPVGVVRAMLTELADSHLITEVRPGRYVLHDLMRSYAGELAAATDGPAQRHAALRRMLDHYLHTSHAADLLLSPHNERLDLSPPVPGAAPTVLASPDDALAWFTAEMTTLLAVTRLAGESDFDTHAWQLASTLHTFLHRRGRWHEAVEAHRGALRAAQRLGSPVALAHSQNLLGRALTNLDLDEARHHLEQAYTRFIELGATGSAARNQQIVGITFEQQGDPTRALRRRRCRRRLGQRRPRTTPPRRPDRGGALLRAGPGVVPRTRPPVLPGADPDPPR